MSKHVHNLGGLEWPFTDPQDVAAICCIHVLQDRPVLRVTHDEDDGGWQILCGGTHTDSDAKLVCLGCMVQREPALLQLSQLPLGWCANRESPASPWQIAENS